MRRLTEGERVNAEPANSGPTADTGGEPETTVDTLTPGETTGTGVEPRVSGIPPSTSESRLCTWIECSHDKRTWAEVQEEEQNAVGERGVATGTGAHPNIQVFCQ